MPITDAQVEAFARRFYPDYAHRLHRVVFEELRAAIEAAERAAWSTDMEAAPRSEAILVRTNACHGLGPITSVCRWHKHAGFCVDELREPVAWRFPPLPPETTDE